MQKQKPKQIKVQDEEAKNIETKNEFQENDSSGEPIAKKLIKGGLKGVVKLAKGTGALAKGGITGAKILAKGGYKGTKAILKGVKGGYVGAKALAKGASAVYTASKK